MNPTTPATAADALAMTLMEPDTVASVAPLFDAYRQFYGKPSAPEAALAFLQQRLANGESIVLGAFLAGRAVGFAQIYPTWSSIRMAPALVLNDLFVDPSARGRGVGEALVRACEAEGQRRGAAALSLETQRSNHAAIALYLRLGWSRDEAFQVYAKALR